MAKTNTTSVPRVLSIIVATFKTTPLFSLTVLLYALCSDDRSASLALFCLHLSLYGSVVLHNKILRKHGSGRKRKKLGRRAKLPTKYKGERKMNLKGTKNEFKIACFSPHLFKNSCRLFLNYIATLTDSGLVIS